jgi:hypothetical protein
MEFAVELMHTSKAFHSMVCNRLEVICHEDLDTSAAPHVFPFVAASLAASRERYSKRIGEARLMVGNCIRMMAHAPKSRAGCHIAAAIGLRSMLEGFADKPDVALHPVPVDLGPAAIQIHQFGIEGHQLSRPALPQA